MENFGRKIELLIADAGGHALDLSGFRVAFKVTKTAAEQPNQAQITIYNLSDETNRRIISGTLTRIVLSAGYEENSAIIFDGNIISTTHVRDGADFVTTIDAGDGDQAYNFATVSQTLAAGATKLDVAQAAAASMAEKNAHMAADTSAIDSETRYPRGRVLFCSSRDAAREAAKASDCQWSIQDGQIVYCKTTKALPDRTAFVLNTGSGMIGSPVIDKDGVQAVCCLNPRLRIYDPLQIESRYVKGTYKILSVEHTGDTHTNTWDTTVKASVIDQSVQETVKL